MGSTGVQPPCFRGHTPKTWRVTAQGTRDIPTRHADARFVQEFLGHSRITTTERYMDAKARPEDVERVNLAFALRASTDAPSAGPM
jgi:integrase